MKVLLRKLQATDAPAIAKLANNPKVAANLRDTFPSPYHLEDAKSFITSRLGSKQCFAITFDGKLCGVISFLPKDNNNEVGYWIGEPFWGKGITTEALKLIVKYGFENLGLKKIFALVVPHNKASMRVLEKAGFALAEIQKGTGNKRGVAIDEYRFEIEDDKLAS